jgi:hypothetical protein
VGENLFVQVRFAVAVFAVKTIKAKPVIEIGQLRIYYGEWISAREVVLTIASAADQNWS